MRIYFIVAALLYAGSVNAQTTITLPDAVARAQQSNESAQIAAARIDRARALKREALAAMLPSLSVGASGTYNGVPVELNGRAIVQQFDWGANGRASITLFDGQMYPLYSASSRGVEAADLDARWAVRVLDFEVEQTFFALAAAERDLKIATRAVELRSAYTERAKALAEQGIALPIDAARARSQELEAQQAVLEATARLGNASDALAVLLGTDADFRADLGQLPRVAPPEAAQSLTRDDVRADFKRLEAIELRESAVWWSLFPTVDLSANSRFGPSSLSNPDGLTWSISLDASWLLYDGGARYARAAAIEAEARETKLNLEQTRRTLGAEGRRALRNWQSAHQAIDVATEKRDVAQQAYDMVLARYESGLTTSIEVTQASEDLFLAELSLSDAELAADLAASQYRFVIGVSP
ncbi:MAG: TolC family protein [bacterium]